MTAGQIGEYKMSKKYKKNNHKLKNTINIPLVFPKDAPCIRIINKTVEIPYSYMMKKDISPLVKLCKWFDEFDPVDCNMFVVITEVPNYQSVSEIITNFIHPLQSYLFKLVSEYPQALMYLRHCDKNCRDDITNAITILDFYTDHHHFEFGLNTFDLVITKLCNYLKSKGKTLSEIFEIVINEVAYPVGVPVDVQKFEYENIPDIETLIRAILGIYELCNGFMWEGDSIMNSDGVVIKYDETAKVISVNCE